LVVGTTYYACVSANNSIGSSAFQQSNNITTALNSPTGVTMATYISGSSISVSWNSVPGATSYTVRFYQTGNPNTLVQTFTSVTSLSQASSFTLANNTTYDASVCANNAGSSSAFQKSSNTVQPQVTLVNISAFQYNFSTKQWASNNDNSFGYYYTVRKGTDTFFIRLTGPITSVTAYVIVTVTEIDGESSAVESGNNITTRNENLALTIKTMPSDSNFSFRGSGDYYNYYMQHTTLSDYSSAIPGYYVFGFTVPNVEENYMNTSTNLPLVITVNGNITLNSSINVNALFVSEDSDLDWRSWHPDITYAPGTLIY